MRPTHAIALALATLNLPGCFWTCGDRSFTDEEVTAAYDVDADGMIVTDLVPGPLDPDAEDACELLCQDAHFAVALTEVSSCELTVALSGGDTADTDALGGVATVTCVASGEKECVGGRHHADLAARPEGRGTTAVGAWLAREAQGEAGSVIAFRRLARELEAHGAPASLVTRARQAAAEEVGHARAVTKLARARGGDVRRATASPPRDRTLLALAVENAVEACVGETFAAALAALQAARAVDAEARAVAARIAPEEASHAELAADLHAWAMSVLPPEDAAMVEAARRSAWRRLAAHADGAPPEVCAALGLPDAAAARALAAALGRSLGVAEA